MLQTLTTKLIENTNPVGVKKTSNWKLPTEHFTYGKKDIPDKEGVAASLYFINISYKKLAFS